MQDRFGADHCPERYRGLAKNTAQIETQFAPVNLWMARKTLRVQ